MQDEANPTTEPHTRYHWQSLRVLFAALALACVFGFLLGSWMNATAITGVRVTMLPGTVEPSDHVVLGIGENDKLPDYKLRIRDRDGWHDIGTFVNTSAANGLEYSINDEIPLRTVQEIQLLEDDKVEDDVLEQLQVSELDLSGKSYYFVLKTASSFMAGMEWFFDTPVGKAILVGITIAIIMIALTLIPF